MIARRKLVDQERGAVVDRWTDLHRHTQFIAHDSNGPVLIFGCHDRPALGARALAGQGSKQEATGFRLERCLRANFDASIWKRRFRPTKRFRPARAAACRGIALAPAGRRERHSRFFPGTNRRERASEGSEVGKSHHRQPPNLPIGSRQKLSPVFARFSHHSAGFNSTGLHLP